ncbi:hypothetical protein BGZ63DRAFT_104894 [Mariannaea sp. PMI_226]|nr:hypothetical protein BGZ63DRAFT_104894 [Mariannaea sp. PMI_226]
MHLRPATNKPCPVESSFFFFFFLPAHGGDVLAHTLADLSTGTTPLRRHKHAETCTHTRSYIVCAAIVRREGAVACSCRLPSFASLYTPTQQTPVMDGGAAKCMCGVCRVGYAGLVHESRHPTVHLPASSALRADAGCSLKHDSMAWRCVSCQGELALSRSCAHAATAS